MKIYLPVRVNEETLPMSRQSYINALLLRIFGIWQGARRSHIGAYGDDRRHGQLLKWSLQILLRINMIPYMKETLTPGFLPLYTERIAMK